MIDFSANAERGIAARYPSSETRTRQRGLTFVPGYRYARRVSALPVERRRSHSRGQSAAFLLIE
jgi:hypothetical protein